ncbi:MAG: hypothetical protein CSA62_03115 [Planctomycetota bacterium]|nr:MAG: hypothetical protein CSA62_03115 [Planctomycetota bacterium]
MEGQRVGRMRRWRRRLVHAAVAVFALALLARSGEALWSYFDPFTPAMLQVHGSSQRVLAEDGSILRVTVTSAGERLLQLRYDELPRLLVRGLVLKEDERFFEHSGWDPWATLRAALQNIAAMKVVSGGSTLTMQLASVLEGTQRSLLDKFHEMRRARQIEDLLSKEEILAAYASVVPLGGTLRGFSAASLYWYGRELDQLQPAEIATLIAMIPAPSKRRPDKRGTRLRSARDKILRLLLQAGELSPAQYRAAIATDPYTKAMGFAFRAPHAVDALLASGASGDALSSSIDLDLQRRVEETFSQGDSFGVDGHAVVLLDRESGAVQAMLGSRSWRQIPFNTATARHDAGSTLKPFLYALAFRLGASSPHRLELDLPIEEGEYRPRNFDKSFSGQIDASQALLRSRNLPAFRLLRRVGVGRFRQELERVGIDTSEIPLHLDLALGTIGVRPIDLARAYQRLAAEAAAGDAAANAVLAALRSHSPPGCRGRLQQAVAWKTGTSSHRRDAWCAGLSKDHVIVVWLGRLDGRPAPELVGIRSAAVLFGQLCLALKQ